MSFKNRTKSLCCTDFLWLSPLSLVKVLFLPLSYKMLTSLLHLPWVCLTWNFTLISFLRKARKQWNEMWRQEDKGQADTDVEFITKNLANFLALGPNKHSSPGPSWYHPIYAPAPRQPERGSFQGWLWPVYITAASVTKWDYSTYMKTSNEKVLEAKPKGKLPLLGMAAECFFHSEKSNTLTSLWRNPLCTSLKK